MPSYIYTCCRCSELDTKLSKDLPDVAQKVSDMASSPTIELTVTTTEALSAYEKGLLDTFMSDNGFTFDRET